MEQFIHLCGNGLFIGIVRIVLLPDRRAGLETMALFLPCSRVELHHDLYGAADRRIRRHCEFLFGGAASHCPEAIARVINNAGYVAVCWLFLYFLYRKTHS